MATDPAVIAALSQLDEDIKQQQQNIYIVAGVLGGVGLALIIAVIALVVAVVQIKKRIRDAEIQKQVEEEMKAQKLTAYTGEELHRKLLAVSTPAVPISPAGPGKVGPDSEYAFNAAFVDNRALAPSQPLPNQGGGPSRLHRF